MSSGSPSSWRRWPRAIPVVRYRHARLGPRVYPVSTPSKLPQLESRIDRITTVAALAVIPVMLIERGATNHGLLVAAWATNWAIWFIFLVDAAIKTACFGSKWLKSLPGALSVAVVVVSCPALTGSLEVARVARLARMGRLSRSVRLIRVARLGLVGWRALSGLSRAMDPGAMPYVTVAVGMVLVFGAAAVYTVELESSGRSLEDGLWWAITTVTTVGYGDITPTTRGGRLVAVAVMAVGIAFTSLLTAQLAAHITSRRQEHEDELIRLEIRRLAERIDGLALTLDGRAEAPAGPERPPGGHD